MAKNKRGQGEGSIRERFKIDKNTGKKVSIGWEARYTAGKDANGKQIRKSIYGKTSDEVKKALRKVLTDMDNGTYIEPAKTTVGAWLDTWFNTYKKPSVKAKTLECYDNIIRNHIKPKIGGIALKDLKADKVQGLYNEVASKFSPRMAELTHVTLHAALEQAIKNDLIIKNVTKATTLPKKVKKEPRVLTPEEQNKFMEAIKGDRMEAAFILDLFTGLRRGELLGLKWADIDFKNKVIKIRQTLCRVKNFDDGAENKTKLVFDTPKTEKGKRVIPLLDEVVNALKTHKNRQGAEKLKAGGLTKDGGLYEDNGLVFCTQIGTPLDPRKFTDIFHAVVEKAGIGETNLHALRHTFATRGLENGIELKVMQELMGHSSITLTADIYSHVLLDKNREAINKLQPLFQTATK